MKEFRLRSTFYGDGIGPGDVLSIGLAANEDNEEYVIVSFSPELTEQDRSLEMTRYYLDTSFAGGDYGCLRAIEFRKPLIIFHLNPRGMAFFETERIIVEMAFNAAQQKRARELLAKEFKKEKEVKLIEV